MSNENEENDSESLEELAKQKLKKDLGKNESPDDLKAENEELKSQMAIFALKSFDEEKAKLVKGKSKEEANKILNFIGDNPDNLKIIQAQQLSQTSDETDDGTEKVPPSGAKIPPYKPTQKETVEDLYEILNSRTSTVDEKQLANKKLDALWKKALSDKKVAKRTIRELQEGE